jgi:hypothetical protein
VRRRAHGAVAVTGVALTLAVACGGSAAPGPEAATATATTVAADERPLVEVRYDRADAPTPCTAKAIGARIVALLAVAGAGDLAELDDILDPDPQFEWYSLTAGDGLDPLWHVVGRSRPAVRAVFEKRRRAGERMRLAVATLRYDARRDRVDVQPIYEYRARDVAAGRPRYGLGKATFTCREGRLRVWSGAVDAGAVAPRRSRYCGLSAGEVRRRVRAGERPVICATRYSA